MNEEKQMAEKKAWRDYIPEPPVIDFAWMKQWWPETAMRKAHVGSRLAVPWNVDVPGEGRVRVIAITKSEARSAAKKMLKLKRLPAHTLVKR